MERNDPFENEEVEQAAAEAGRIGGVAGDEDLPPAERPLAEAGEGYAEGFEQAEEDLIEHASHGDEHSARMGLYHAAQPEEAGADSEYGESDAMPSSNLEEGDEQGRAVENAEPPGGQPD